MGKIFILFAILFLAASCNEPKPSGSPNDQYHTESRAKRENYSETTSINACSDESGNCYVVTADIAHRFSDDGKESVYVQQIYFDNGGYLTFEETSMPGSGTDQKGHNWSFSY